MNFGKLLKTYNLVSVIASVAKQSRQLMGCFVVSLLAMTFLASPSNAQTSSYTPPPMFDDMTPPMVRPQAQDGYIVEPKKSTRTPSAPASPKPAIVPPRVSVDPDAKRSAPAMMKPIIEPEKPVDAPKKSVQKSEKKKPAAATAMPALPAADVDGQVTFDDGVKPEKAETMLERHQKEAGAKKSETLSPVPPGPGSDVLPAAFDKSGQDALKKTILYDPGQIGLPAADSDPVAAGVIKELGADGKKDWRVQIKSYASPHGAGLSSDRRISLNRALSLRSTLIARGVSPSRIDVLAEGMQGEDSGPADRIDLYLYGLPQE